MCKCKICGSSGKQGEVLLIECFHDLSSTICGKCIQPERVKRSDTEDWGNPITL